MCVAISVAIAAWATSRAPSVAGDPTSVASTSVAVAPTLVDPAASTSVGSTSVEVGPTPVGSTPVAPTPVAPTPVGSTSVAPAGLLARATSTEPGGVHVALDAKLVVHFDRPVAPEGVTVTVEPPIEGKPSWPDPQTLVFTPPTWHEGKRHHVQVAGPGIEPVAFQFSTLAPPPARIEPGGGSRITLTFDDGASRPAQVSEMLDILEKEGVQAIFFPTGHWAETHPRLIERMVRDGHRVCNHTYSHQNLRLPNLSEATIRKEIAKGAGAGTCKLFRPPMRAFDPRVERIVADMGYTMYLWDVDSRDWEDLPADDMVNRILKRARPGSVVLFHMHAAETLKALPVVIKRLKKAGYVLRDPEDAGAP